jgi:hypothetical protein
MDLFHNEIISFCLRKATIKLASDCTSVNKKLTKEKNNLNIVFELPFSRGTGFHGFRLANCDT